MCTAEFTFNNIEIITFFGTFVNCTLLHNHDYEIIGGKRKVLNNSSYISTSLL